MTVRFEDAWLKVGRAESHLRDLKKRCDTFLNKKPYLIQSYLDEESGCDVVKFVVKHQPKPGLGLILGDYVQNARSALDLAIAEMADPDAHAKGVRTQYPIVSGPTKKRTAPEQFNLVAESALRGVPDAVVAFIERCQPYHWPSPELAHVAEILAAFSNADKHRLIHPQFLAMFRLRVRVVPAPEAIYQQIDGPDLTSGPPPWVLHDGAELVRLRIESATPYKVRVEPPEIGIGFDSDHGFVSIRNISALLFYVKDLLHSFGLLLDDPSVHIEVSETNVGAWDSRQVEAPS